MWRLWTKGWYLSGWWCWFKEMTPFWIAQHLPKSVVLWSFIIVYAKTSEAPGPDYVKAYNCWVKE